MYAKVFRQIFDSSIAEDYQVRHVFEDLLKLADIEGFVDMTVNAIARRTNVPLEIVTHGIGELCKPDPKSRSRLYEGRRLIPIDPERDWGWQIVNYEHYRAIQDEEARRATYRKSKAAARAKEKAEGTKPLKRGKPLVGEGPYVRHVNAGGDPAVMPHDVTATPLIHTGSESSRTARE